MLKIVPIGETTPRIDPTDRHGPLLRDVHARETSAQVHGPWPQVLHHAHRRERLSPTHERLDPPRGVRVRDRGHDARARGRPGVNQSQHGQPRRGAYRAVRQFPIGEARGYTAEL